MKSKGTYFLGLLIVLLVIACTPSAEVVPINFGKDQCSYCKMTIANPKFGAELITDKGRALKYDAVECMINRLLEENIQYKALYAVPFNEPKQLKKAESLQFLITADIRSPMGANLSAYSDTNQVAAKYHNQLMSWEELVTRLNSSRK